MGRLIAVLALAGATVFIAHPGPSARAHASGARAAASTSRAEGDAVLAAAQRDFAKRQAEVGLVGSAPLFGAEGLPKPKR